MKKILIIAILLISLAGPVAAYEISIFAPASLNTGEPITVNGTTNLPPGTSFDITLSHSDYVTEVKDTRSVVIQQEQNFSVVFPTVGYVKGTYKIEVLPISQVRYLGNSVTLRVIELKDRSDEVTLSSPLTQYPNGNLIVTGVDKHVSNRGIELQITGPDGAVIFGPAYITTTASGAFSKETPINATGNYTVRMADQEGYLGTYIIRVLPRASGEVPDVTQYVPVSIPQATASSLSSASSFASRDQPAYFTVSAKPGPVRVYTSSGTDWVIEYMDDSGKRVKMNNKGHDFPEEVTVQGNSNDRYFMVYPNKYSDSGTVTLYAENANDVKADSVAPAGFASAGVAVPDTTKKTPLSPWAVVSAIAGGLLAYRRRS
ncbi:MAG TPA: hypothetical protein VMS89_09720 [Methanoregulaceae archaeon]|nr:hypothetical protein [Methanoregulaceae archaeon]